ncbi:PREDICTED: protein SON-like [Wasmannia auropunctata]|uniref:protein SON-like n=1 Tax=Wasmannia auropunctata TaxID=64793 RepID=UPI0005EFD90B|nr:PREDICTED: protein SON-like [Wasmannia auropunctata]
MRSPCHSRVICALERRVVAKRSLRKEARFRRRTRTNHRSRRALSRKATRTPFVSRREATESRSTATPCLAARSPVPRTPSSRSRRNRTGDTRRSSSAGSPTRTRTTSSTSSTAISSNM